MLPSLPVLTKAHMQAMARLQQAIPSMLSWVQRFLRPVPAKNATVAVRPGEGVAGGNLRPMCVRQVVDIEENVWAPKYGLKGMIDASLAASFHTEVIGLQILSFLGSPQPGKKATKTHTGWTACSLYC